MFRRSARAAAACLAATSFIALAACTAGMAGFSRLPRQDLFRLSIGRMEDQLDIGQASGNLGKLRIYMRDGLIFICNGQGRKVMKFSSYGDLLSLVYNPDYNPAPVIMGQQGDGAALKRSHELPLREAGEIVVNSRKEFFVEDRLPPDRGVREEEMDILLDAVILRFAQDGSFRDYLGQEGLGGTPFANVSGLYCTAGDDIVVVSATRSSYDVFWFDDGQTLAHSLSVRRDALPMPAQGQFNASLEKIVPGDGDRMLYMKVDYYRELLDPSTGVQVGVEFDRSLVWSLDPADGRIFDPVEVPVLRIKEGTGFGTGDYVRGYELLGLAADGHMCFIMPEDDGSYALLTMDRYGGRTRKFRLDPGEPGLLASSLQLGLDGIVTGIFVGAREARVSWWRIDKAIGK
jgi:hypothetical protein